VSSPQPATLNQATPTKHRQLELQTINPHSIT
jgi:hypothetical protein